MSVPPCDADSVETAAYAVLTPAGPITLCGHHYREHRAVLLARGYPADVLDRTELAWAYVARHARQPAW